MKTKHISYSHVGDNYHTKDPIKKFAQASAAKTGSNLKFHKFMEISDTRGESAYVWKQGKIFMASVIEGLGSKNLVADSVYLLTGKSYYDHIAHDTVATIINDLISTGATPLVIHAYWAVEDNRWFNDLKKVRDLVRGWKSACDEARVSWGGGETPTLKGIIVPGTIELGGSAVGTIKSPKRLITDRKLLSGDRILFVQSAGINANGLSLARAVAGELSDGYRTKINKSKSFGEALLTKSHIYAGLLEKLSEGGVNLHYISHITGHGLRKIMRARKEYSYIIENIFDPQEEFLFIQKHAGLSDREMYGTFNMGMDYALFLPGKDIDNAQKIIRAAGYNSIPAGYVSRGRRRVIIKPKNIEYASDELDLR